MARQSSERFEIPSDLRFFAEQRVVQARMAIERVLRGASEAVEDLEGRAEAVQTGAKDIAKRSMSYAEQNVAASLDLAEKLLRAKNASEIMRLQSDFLGRQMQALAAQMQDFGRSAIKLTADAVRPPH